MRPERYSSQSRLLASVRADGHQATALDTGNSFTYRTGVGWTPLVPMNGLAGQPLVVAVDRGISSFDTTNRLVPEGGTPGQLTAVDQFGETSLVTPVVPGGLTYPVDFSSGSITPALDRVIPAGALGPNGYLRYTAVIGMVTDASRTVAWTPTGGGLSNELDTVALGSSANTWGIEYNYLMVNTGSETAQVITSTIKWGLYAASAHTSSSEDLNQQTGHIPSSVDTTVDWQLSADVQATAGAVTGFALVYGVAVEYGYAA